MWNEFVAMVLPKQERKKNCCNWFVTMPLPKFGGKFCGNCGNAIAENGWKKKIVVAEI